MKVVLSILTTAAVANAHFTMQYMWINGVDQGLNNSSARSSKQQPSDGRDVHRPHLQRELDFLARVLQLQLLPQVQTSRILEWHQHAQRTGEPAISGGHKGPVQVYIAPAGPVGSASSFNGQGSVWTKIYSSGLVDPATQEWASDVVNANNGKHSVIIPPSLPSGDYLIRGEIIALHVAETYPGAQFYIGCAQVTITGGGNAKPPTIALPGAYKGSDPGITVRINCRHRPLMRY
ncbi:glycosyl hydrolase family 61-domain-containing protein [Desarmillaria tabescens]|uniref:AA9 family lytic polysaccharide monooxygenase n=1 Tax=Armillaria tabescens TaxID=1929756 RepID=A0AA39J010_ARMTA|nr:glycosyl hydrolase family 61-domain-containing protein [Desarmillaria tabescens]KAK0432821.1 glycosyl hydrolase family 61-domain-containing protein [Desarmillaria tabescens]